MKNQESVIEFKIDKNNQGSVTIKGDILELGQFIMVSMLKNEPLAEILKAAVKGHDVIKEKEKIKTPKIIMP